MTNDRYLIQTLLTYPILFRQSDDGGPFVGVEFRSRSGSFGNQAGLAEVVLENRRNGEAYPRWQVLGDGSMSSGNGTVAPTPISFTGVNADLSLAADPDLLIFGAVTRDDAGLVTSAAVKWPDGTTGTYTPTFSTVFPGAVASYTITKGAQTFTQPTLVRDSSGNVTSRPAITVA